MIGAEKLRALRNRVPIADALALVDLPRRESEGQLRFLCPICREFNSATNPRTNLARCFRCERNFNPIDLVMVVERASFLEAIARLEPLLRA